MRAKAGLLAGLAVASAVVAAFASGPEGPAPLAATTNAGLEGTDLEERGDGSKRRAEGGAPRPLPDLGALRGVLSKVPPSPGADSTFQFSRVLVDQEVANGEPVLSLESGGKRWVAGTKMPSATHPAYLWSSADGGATFQKETVPTPGSGDATIFVGTDGRLYWAALGDSGLELASRPLSGGSWVKATFSSYDRPWFLSRSGITFAVAADTANNHIDIFTSDGQGGWNGPVMIPGTTGTNSGFPVALPDGRLFIPLWAGQQRKAAISDAAVSQWDVQTAPGPQEDAHIPWAAVDAVGNAYLAWDNNAQAKFVSWNANTGWRGPTTVSTLAAATTWTITVIAGGEGKIDVAWYSRLPNNGLWQVLFRQVTDAHLEQPNLGQAVVELEPLAADSIDEPRRIFLDFLTLTKLSDGNAAITFNCRLDSLWNPPHPYCPRAGASRVVYGQQTAGPTI